MEKTSFFIEQELSEKLINKLKKDGYVVEKVLNHPTDPFQLEITCTLSGVPAV